MGCDVFRETMEILKCCGLGISNVEIDVRDENYLVSNISLDFQK